MLGAPYLDLRCGHSRKAEPPSPGSVAIPPLAANSDPDHQSCQALKPRIPASIQHIRVAYQLPSNRYTGSREIKGP